MKKLSPNIILGAIIGIAALLRIVNLAGPDMIADDALYSFRALGYFDYIGSLNTQTTPVVWFPESQWWQYLSFHDAPPLVFIIQWFFFKIFGENLLAARLPFVIAGLLAIYFIFLLGKLLVNERAGLIAAAALTIMNFHIWISRIGLLDGFVVLWIVLALYFFVKSQTHERNYIWWGIFTGLGILTKYTFLFMLPLFLVALLWWRREAWRKKWFYFGLVIFLITILPVIIYNVMIFKTRGHFDAALSTMIGQHPEDFKGLTREIKTDPLELTGVFKVIAQKTSLGLAIFILPSLLIFIYQIIKNRHKTSEYNLNLIWLGIFLAITMLTFSGGNDRYAAVILPFVVSVLGLSVYWFWEKLKTRWQRLLMMVCLLFIAGWEIIFAIQNQLVPEPKFIKSSITDTSRPLWLGYNKLEVYVKDFYRRNPNPSYVVFAKTPQIFSYQFKKVQSYYEQEVKLPQTTELLVFDDRIDWAAALWIFERRRIYEVAAVPSLTNLLDSIDEKYFDKFIEFGFRHLTVIMATNILPHNQSVDSKRIKIFETKLLEAKKPIQEIKNYNGEVIFKVFELPIDNDLTSFRTN